MNRSQHTITIPIADYEELLKSKESSKSKIQEFVRQMACTMRGDTIKDRTVPFKDVAEFFDESSEMLIRAIFECDPKK